MALSIPIVWSDRCLAHDPHGGVWLGVPVDGDDLPARAQLIREALLAAGADLVEAASHGDDALLRVHDRPLLQFLSSAWDEWTAAGVPDEGQDVVVPYIFPHGALAGARLPAAVWARPGRFAYDTMTVIGRGTWESVRAAVDVALTAAELVLGGVPAAYACCRPPGHHAGRRSFGGSCYLNNAAAAAALLAEAFERVAVLDVDAHHGNGTQEIFREQTNVLTGSLHVDPDAGWFPHYVGFADESDAANRNLPLAPGTGDEAWVAGVRELAEWAGGAEALVVALGVDAAAGDPESPLEVTAAGFREAGRILGGLRVPTVVVQEGGYDLEMLGVLVLETLLGMEEAR